MARHPLAAFIIIAFAINWSLAAVLIFFGAQLAPYIGIIGPYHPLFFLGVYSPTLAALIVILRLHGFSGLKRFFIRRVLRWRVQPVLVVSVIGAFFAMHVGIRLYQGGSLPAFGYSWLVALPVALSFVVLDAGPIGTELGWRGFALPLLQRKFSPWLASVIVGVIWATWELPAFYVSSLTQSNYSFFTFLIGVVFLAIIMTCLYNLTRGSILMTITAHWMANIGGDLHIRANTNEGLTLNNISFMVFAAILLAVTRRTPPVVDPIPTDNNLMKI